jgi:hypothetical protein
MWPSPVPISREKCANVRGIFDFSAENAKIADWLAEQSEFELAVPILEQPDDSWLFGSIPL